VISFMYGNIFWNESNNCKHYMQKNVEWIFFVSFTMLGSHVPKKLNIEIFMKVKIFVEL
jgi:hypothetical protein